MSRRGNIDASRERGAQLRLRLRLVLFVQATAMPTIQLGHPLASLVPCMLYLHSEV